MKPLLTASKARELLDYNPETGVFRRKLSGHGRVAGQIAGTKQKDGYLQFSVDGRMYFAHRVAWLYVTGSWPTEQIDHINGVGTDNRFANLREATGAQNQWNKGRKAGSLSGLKGVAWNAALGKWQAQIKADKKAVYLGVFNCPTVAHFAYVRASHALHGKFGRVA